MGFLILTLIMAGFIALAWTCHYNDWDVTFTVVTWVACVYGFFYALITTFTLFTYINLDALVQEKAALRENLVYQLEYENYTGAERKELIDEIKEFNTDLAAGKAGGENWFSNIFYPEKLYDFEPIETK